MDHDRLPSRSSGTLCTRALLLVWFLLIGSQHQRTSGSPTSCRVQLIEPPKMLLTGPTHGKSFFWGSQSTNVTVLLFASVTEGQVRSTRRTGERDPPIAHLESWDLVNEQDFQPSGGFCLIDNILIYTKYPHVHGSKNGVIRLAIRTGYKVWPYVYPCRKSGQ